MSVRSLNKVMLIGNLTRDPELRYTSQGTAVCTFGVATNRGWVTDGGDKREETEFHRIVSWSKLAELCSQLLTKGRKVYIEGRLQTRSWTGKDDVQRSSTEIVINEMIILDSRRPVEKTSADTDYTTQKSNVTDKKEVIAEEKDSTDKSDSQEKNKSDTKSEKKKDDKKTEKSSDEDISPDDIPF